MTGPDDPHNPDSLVQYTTRILNFYHPECLDEDYGGYIAQFGEETGDIYDRKSKHLVSHCRFVVNYSAVALINGREESSSAAEHGFNSLLGPQHCRR